MAQSASESLKNHAPSILDAAIYHRGIYKTFDEFKFNAPSWSGDFSFSNNELWIADGKGSQKKVDKKEVWGFCDGDKIYVLRSKYNELLVKGRYCYFTESGARIFPLVSVIPPFIIPIPARYKHEIIISFNTGKTYVLSRKVMKTILKEDDPELLKEYLKQKKKRQNGFNFIVRYNARNADKIK